MILRDYQDAGVQRIRFSYLSGRRAPLYVLPTGGGKSLVFAYIASQALARGSRVFILVHRQELLTQTSRTLAGLEVPHGRIASGSRKSRDSIQIASVQTLARRLDSQSPPDLIIVDEGHHLTPTTQWGKVIKAFPRARILGVTATPTRMDGQGLGLAAGGFYDDLILGPSVAELTARGFLCPAEVYAPNRIDLSGVRKSKGDFERKDLAGRMDKSSITGDAVAHYRKICDRQPAIAFCVSIEHAHHVAEQFKAEGYQAACIDGKTQDSVRREAIADLGRGSLHVLTSCEIVSEGTDIPIVAAALMLRPTQSEALALQQMGRALRPYPGKRFAYILDHAGNCLRHGLPDEERFWTLDGRQRKKRGKDEDEDSISIRQCKTCFRVFHASANECPGCGAPPPIKIRQVEQKPGELVKLDKQREEMKRREEIRQARTFEELQEFGRLRGYKEGWARHIWSAREGRKFFRHG